MPTEKISKRLVDKAQPRAATYLIRDVELKGFVLVVTASGTKSYAVDYRAGTGRRAQKRRVTIGKHGSPWTPEAARKEALKLLGDVARGLDPASSRDADRTALSLAEICDLYLRLGATHKKSATLKADKARIEYHIKPLIGAKRIGSIGRADVERLLVDVSEGKTAARLDPNAKRSAGSVVKGGKGVASQCVTLLATILAFAVRRKLRSDNPAHGIKKYPVRKLERFLSLDEIRLLAIALESEEQTTGNKNAVAAIRLLLLTGCRKNEILSLNWRDVDLETRCLRLPDSKTGAKIVYLNSPALAIFGVLSTRRSSSNVFNGAQSQTQLLIDKVWSRVRRHAGLVDVRLHDLRHSFASIGVIGGLSLPILGALLGHKHPSTTDRYAHLASDPIRAANDLIGKAIENAMRGTSELPRLKSE